MGKKKKPGRFTLQFNLEDPQQQMVSELLEQQGRRKAQFITSAVLHYIQSKTPRDAGQGLSAIDKMALEQMILAVLEKHPQFMPTPPAGRSEAEDSPAQFAPTAKRWEDSVGDDAVRALSDTLAAFQQS